MLHFNRLPGVPQPDTVTGVTEHEESDEDKDRQHHGHDRQPLVVREIVARLPQFCRELALWVAPHLIIYSASRGA
nr:MULTISPECIES: hypothetical protein [Muribaculaceae]